MQRVLQQVSQPELMACYSDKTITNYRFNMNFTTSIKPEKPIAHIPFINKADNLLTALEYMAIAAR